MSLKLKLGFVLLHPEYLHKLEAVGTMKNKSYSGFKIYTKFV